MIKCQIPTKYFVEPYYFRKNFFFLTFIERFKIHLKILADFSIYFNILQVKYLTFMVPCSLQ